MNASDPRPPPSRCALRNGTPAFAPGCGTLSDTPGPSPVSGIIAVGLSGGVDSTMAALLLQQAGHQVIGLTMSIWDGSVPLDDAGRSGCFGPGEARDIARAQAIARRLGIPHHVITLAADYRRGVLDYFCNEYRCGRTPNPCVVCNQRMKFGLLPERARAQGIAFDRFATGHYARIRRDPVTGRHRLLRGIDPDKDQSYFLARLTQAQLATTEFPLGEYHKPDVADMARSHGFGELADQPESQDFIESDDYSPLFAPGDSRPGPIVDPDGKVLGQHRGIIHYTIGQREGLGISSTSRLYVKELRPETNTLVVAPHDALLRDDLLIEQMHWINEPPPDGSAVMVRLRYRHRGAEAHLEHAGTDAWRARLTEPQFAITPGQAAVCYLGDECLGGGWIASKAVN